MDEFQTVLGWDDAKPGGTFIKIGVGVLRKTGTEYNRYFPYEIVDSGKWTVEKAKGRNRIPAGAVRSGFGLWLCVQENCAAGER